MESLQPLGHPVRNAVLGITKKETHCINLCTRWFKYDRDKLWLVYTQSVPVIFEPPCIRFAFETPCLNWWHVCLFHSCLCSNYFFFLRFLTTLCTLQFTLSSYLGLSRLRPPRRSHSHHLHHPLAPCALLHFPNVHLLIHPHFWTSSKPGCAHSKNLTAKVTVYLNFLKYIYYNVNYIPILYTFKLHVYIYCILCKLFGQLHDIYMHNICQ